MKAHEPHSVRLKMRDFIVDAKKELCVFSKSMVAFCAPHELGC